MTLPKQLKNLKFLSRLRSDKNLTQKASLNSLASILDYGARLVVSFVVNPLLVTGLGDFGYGVWQVLGQLIGFVAPASGRPTQALKWTIASLQASTDYQAKRRHVGSTVVIWLLFLPVMAILGGLLAWFTPIWLDVPAEQFQTVRLAAILLVVNLIMTSLLEVPQAVLRGENLGYKRMGLSALLVFTGGAFMVMALYFNTGLIGVATATLASTLLGGALFFQVVRTYVPWFGIAKPSRIAVRRFLNLSGWFLVWNLVMRMMQAGDVVVLGIFGSAELVTTYTLTKYSPGTLINFVAIIVTAITPGLGTVIGAGDFPKAIRVRNEIMLYTWLLVTAMGSTILLWNKSFIQLWVGAEYYAGRLSDLLIVIAVAQFVIIRNDANIIDLTLDLRHKVLIGLLSTTLALLGASVAVGFFNLGIVGLCLSFIVGRSILSLGYPWLIGRFLNMPLLTQIKGVLRPTTVTILFFVCMSYLTNFLVANTWFWFVFSAGTTLMVLSPLTFFAGLSGGQRAQVWRRIRRVV